MQEDVGFDRRNLLGIGLIERYAAGVVVVRMDQHGRLRGGDRAERQRGEQQNKAEIRFHCRLFLTVEFECRGDGRVVGEIPAAERVGQHLAAHGPDAAADEDVVQQRPFGFGNPPEIGETPRRTRPLRGGEACVAQNPSSPTCAITGESGSALKSPVRIAGRSPRSESMRCGAVRRLRGGPFRLRGRGAC